MSISAPIFPAQEGDAPGKGAILREALRLFVMEGLDATSIRRIAKDAGLTNPALFRHFAGKDALALHLFEQCYRRLYAAVATPSGQEFEARLADMVERYLRAYDEQPEAVLYVHDTLRRLWPRASPDLRRLSLIGSMRALLKQGLAEGRVGMDVDVSLAAGAVLGVLAQVARMRFFAEFSSDLEDLIPAVLRLVRGMLT